MSRPTKEQAIDAFFNRFGAFYESGSVPDGENKPSFPYGTYELAADSFGSEVAISVSWWERSSSWTAANAKAREIAAAVTRGGVMLPCVGGGLWIKRGTPFERSMGDEADIMLKRKLFNFTIEFITEV